MGLEPIRACAHKILSLARLPITPSRRIIYISKQRVFLEAQAGIEPAHNDFADRRVTSSPLGRAD